VDARFKSVQIQTFPFIRDILLFISYYAITTVTRIYITKLQRHILRSFILNILSIADETMDDNGLTRFVRCT